MKRCDRCRVEFSGDLDRCPLCHGTLEGPVTPAIFPRNVVKKSGTLALAVLGFVTGASLLVMLFLGHLLGIPGDIVVTVCVALAINYLFVRNIIMHSPDFLRVVARYFLVLLALAAIWFLVTGNLIVTTFVIPGICLVALVYDSVLVAVFRSTFVARYAKYLLFDVVLGLVPLALVAFGLVFWDIPAYVSALMASVFLLGLLAFMRKQLAEEVRRLFNA